MTGFCNDGCKTGWQGNNCFEGMFFVVVVVVVVFVVVGTLNMCTHIHSRKNHTRILKY